MAERGWVKQAGYRGGESSTQRISNSRTLWGRELPLQITGTQNFMQKDRDKKQTRSREDKVKERLWTVTYSALGLHD